MPAVFHHSAKQRYSILLEVILFEVPVKRSKRLNIVSNFENLSQYLGRRIFLRFLFGKYIEKNFGIFEGNFGNCGRILESFCSIFVVVVITPPLPRDRGTARTAIQVHNVNLIELG